MKTKILLLGIALAVACAVPAHAEGGAYARFQRADRAAQRGCLGAALRLIDEAIALDPANGEYHRLRGFILRDMGLTLRARKELERARRSGDAVAMQRANEGLLELGVDHRSVPLVLGPDPAP